MSRALMHLRSDPLLTDAARHPSTSPVGAHPGATGHTGKAPRAQVRSYRHCDSSGKATLHVSAVASRSAATGTAAPRPCPTSPPPDRR
ncbi:hypothetical protein XaplCFBP3122_19930 [Xanthomonas arboricola pv. populi]|uniref:Uncharacterized protein n=1 Tax=Xanthomonas arboricola pv. populi TaxID=487823 RepID=A0A2S6YZK0_9XANT|nr:hypothetical protein XaplCFBP3122_19930 [Xanthomonas arboricola pv. populi]